MLRWNDSGRCWLTSLPTGLSLVGEVTAEELGLTEDEAVVLGPLAVSLDLTNVKGWSP